MGVEDKGEPEVGGSGTTIRLSVKTNKGKSEIRWDFNHLKQLKGNRRVKERRKYLVEAKGLRYQADY